MNSSGKVYIEMNKPKDDCFTREQDAQELATYLSDIDLLRCTETNLDNSESTPTHNHLKIWMPFGDKGRNISKAFSEGYYKQQCDIIITDGDFYTYSITKTETNEFLIERQSDNTHFLCNVIISNPPFSKRTQLFSRLFESDIPFVLLQPIQMFNNKTMIKHIINHQDDLGFLCPENRMGFISELQDSLKQHKSASFYSFWFCHKTSIIGWKQL